MTTTTQATRLAPILLTCLLSCSGSSPTSPTVTSDSADGSGSTATSSLPAFYNRFTTAVTITQSGGSAILRSQDLPSHPSPYYGTGHALYVAPQAGMVVNPNRIVAQNYELRIPMSPQARSTGTSTSLDAIGIAVNGVVLFNQYAAGFSPLDNELLTFDQYNGHPAGRGNYHYHIDPVAITAADPAALVGVLLDGFPVYGRHDVDGTNPVDLDECNGHIGPTPDSTTATYHYHITSAYPYISGCYRGTPGTVTN